LQLNRELIMRTMLCFWSQMDDSYIAWSPLFDMTVGMGATRDEAISSFNTSIENFYADYERDRLHGYGSHASPRHPLTANVRAGTFNLLRQLQNRYQCSVDEAVDYLAGYLLMAGLPQQPDGERKTPLD
jgi:hypothetical protein